MHGHPGLEVGLFFHECPQERPESNAVPNFTGGRDADPLGRRMRRARKEGALCGRREAKLFRLAVRRAADRAKAIDWLNTAVSEGRAELEA
jgi:hypothetical protein